MPTTASSAGRSPAARCCCSTTRARRAALSASTRSPISPSTSGYAIFASKAGAPTNPDWYYNLKANPDTTVEIGDDTIPVHARVAEGDERDKIWTKQVERAPGFGEYEAKSGRTIPVVILEPR